MITWRFSEEELMLRLRLAECCMMTPWFLSASLWRSVVAARFYATSSDVRLSLVIMP
jgi:hypothetical protein